jgi:hypothetical protein
MPHTRGYRRYGYMFAAVEARIDTKLLQGLVEYTDYFSAAHPPHGPSIIHYGLHCHVGSYHFTKYDYTNFDINSCPRLFFRSPGVPSARQAICAETINTLNDALCDFYRRTCPGDEALECPPHVAKAEEAPCANLREDCDAVVKAGQCHGERLRDCAQSCTGCCGDEHPRCLGWAFGGECKNNPGFMKSTCKLSCHQCETAAPAANVAPKKGASTSEPEGGAHAQNATSATSATSGSIRDALAEVRMEAAGELDPEIEAERSALASMRARVSRWEQYHAASDEQLGIDLAIVLLIGLGLLAAIWLTRRCTKPLPSGKKRRERREAGQVDNLETLMVRTC